MNKQLGWLSQPELEPVRSPALPLSPRFTDPIPCLTFGDAYRLLSNRGRRISLAKI